ncbi:hypothetical protein C0J52_12377 [Blattella germanica]|nr:hypothetical protein C0J52_12377 [Blattella germanica]
MEAVKPESSKEATITKDPETATGDVTTAPKLDDTETPGNLSATDPSTESSTVLSSEVTAEESEETKRSRDTKMAPSMTPENKKGFLPSASEDMEDALDDTPLKTSPFIKALSAIKSLISKQAEETTKKEQTGEVPKVEFDSNVGTATVKTALAQNEEIPSTSKDESKSCTQTPSSTAASKENPTDVSSSSKNKKEGFVAAMTKLFSKETTLPASAENEDDDHNVPKNEQIATSSGSGVTADTGSTSAFEKEDTISSRVEEIIPEGIDEPGQVQKIPAKSQHDPSLDNKTASSEHSALRQLTTIGSIKIVVVGDIGVGKTTLIKRYTNDIFIENTKPTISVDISTKLVKISDTETVQLNIHDIAGQHRLSHLTRNFYRNANAVIIVYDQSTMKLSNVIYWKTEVEKNCGRVGSKIPCVLVGNKCDLLTEEKRQDRFQKEFAERNKFDKLFVTSAKLGIGIDKVMEYIIEKVDIEQISASLKENVVLTEVEQPSKPRGKCAGKCAGKCF